ncbi:ParA family protein [Reinekea blandensis]|uniref:Sporulation initiation inhibitor protein Soj n=1 Tax=Reinekea blandensis MED297 TaxID=314283 RepID=A4BJW7_9GAMM|nr:ParA family protein [Reinekea blandensis]EAR07568.1 sporulation initiation inhibitor protein Soj [Reinekea sp. MED297] [Reinekea blandensis MED297]
MKAEIIAVGNQKGGCGKTSSIMNFSRLSVLDGKKTLLIDLDPNESATIASDVLSGLLPTIIEEKNVCNLFKQDPPDPSSLIVETKDGYDMIIGSMDLVVADQFLMNESEASKYLIDLLYDDEALNQYDRIFIDTGGRVGPMLTAAIVAADKVITPSKASMYDTPQTKRFPAFVEKCAKIKARDRLYMDRPVELVKVFFNEVSERAATTSDVIVEFMQEFDLPGAVSETFVPFSNEMKRGQAFNQTIVDWRPKSAPAQAYVKIYNEVFNSNFTLEGANNG